jgi:hypothetical protein
MKYKKWLKKLEDVKENDDYLFEDNEDDGEEITPNKLRTYNRVFIKVLQEYLKTEDNILFNLNSHWEQGYFIFDMGQDSVFITECQNNKEWLFGFWFDEITNEDGAHYRVRAFAQPTLTLDKFKPSRSEFLEELLIPMDHLTRVCELEVDYSEDAIPEKLNKVMYDYINFGHIYQMIKYIVDNPTDALYYDWFCHKKYYRLPNKLKTWWKVFKFKYSENKRKKTKDKITAKCYKFIETKLKPLFSEEKCNAELEVIYRDFMSPAFQLRIKTCDKLYTSTELNERLICTYAEYLCGKWNKYLESLRKKGIWAYDQELSLDYWFISEDDRRKGLPVWGSCDYASLEELEEELKSLKKQFNLKTVKQCIWLDLEEDNAR